MDELSPIARGDAEPLRRAITVMALSGSLDKALGTAAADAVGLIGIESGGIAFRSQEDMLILLEGLISLARLGLAAAAEAHHITTERLLQRLAAALARQGGDDAV